MSQPALLHLEQLRFAYADHVLFDGLNAHITPGLTWVRGGDGRGKTTLLRLIAGELKPASGHVRHAGALFYADMREAKLDDVLAHAWLAQQAQQFTKWNSVIADGSKTIEEVGMELFELMLDVASGRKKTWAEHWKLHNALVLFNPAPVT